MFGRYNRLVFTVLTATILILIFGCTQPDDIVAPVSNTKIILSPERLPALPSGMYYQVWAIDTAQNAYSIGSFIWKSRDYQFADLDSNDIDSIWNVNYDIMDPFYRFISVSVEQLDDRPSGSPLPISSIGPIMLQDTIYSTDHRLMKMVFPLDLWLGYGFFSIETPSDSNSYTNDASGLWFAEYLFDSIIVADTTNVQLTIANELPRPLLLDVHAIDTVYFRCDQFHRYKWDSCIASHEVTSDQFYPDSLSPKGVPIYFIETDTLDADTSVVICSTDECDTLPLVVLETTLDTVDVNRIKVITDSSYMLRDSLVMDTFVHTYIEFDYVAPVVNIGTTIRYDTVTIYSNYDEETDTWLTEQQRIYLIRPFMSYDHNLNFTYTERSVKVDKFINSFEECPNLADPDHEFFPEYDGKWHYKGWVLSPYLTPRDAFGSLTIPEWLDFYVGDAIRPLDGAMISTGTFKNFDAPDDGNPYTDNHRVPPYPGEDFLLNLPDGVTSIQFATPGNHEGSILVTLEPDNYDSYWTNFPLILFVGSMPTYGEMTITSEHSQRTLAFDVKNWSSTLNGNGVGFPAIHVSYIRE